MKNITAVILAAGMGTRMKTDLPKVLHPVASQTMLGKTIAGLRKAGVEDIIAVIGYKAEMVEGLFKDKIRFVRQPELLGSGDALAHAVDFMGKGEGKVLVTCGDTPLITAETYKKMKQAHMKERLSCALLTCLVDDPSSYGRIMRDKKGEVSSIIEEKDLTAAGKKIKEINVGTYCFKRSELRKFIGDIELNEKKKEFYLTDIVDILKKNGKKIVSVSCGSEEAIGVNSRRELALVNKIAYRRKAEDLMDSGVTLIDPDTAYVDSSAVIGRDTVIYPNTVIEAGVTIGAGCKIGPFARLRPGTKLEDNVEIGNFVELCRAEVGRKSKVKHHTYLGDTVVGENVNIGAGTITANYDGKDKNRTVIGNGAFIGVGAVLIAPVKIGADAVVGAGSVVTRNKNVKSGETVIGIPARPMNNKKKEK
jgi:bifunctional UDP-N-acetylglucosamine pyrophosphorylase / glucosamine-1-phosphate N-acetyltransferase